MDKDASEFSSVAEAVSHYQDLCRSLEQQVKDAHDDMDDYTESTKELQQELETELDRMDKSEKEMRIALEAAENDKDEWKTKYTTSLREHTQTMTHMQRELESLRSAEKGLRDKLRDMELDNDDLEKSEREKDSSLQDLENRYNKNLERIALLEEELVIKAQLEEEVQRLKDELRDLQEEVAFLRKQSEAAAAAAVARLQSPTPLSATAAADPAPLDRTLSASPISSTNDSSFATPRRSGSPASTASSTPPAFALAGKPAPTAGRALASPSPAPSATGSTSSASTSAAVRVRKQSAAKPPTPGGGIPRSTSTLIRADSRSSAATALSRSVRGLNLASAVHTTGATGMTPKATREKRANDHIQDMRDMTTRIKALTRRLDSRRDLVMAGSAIPRASMSPGGVQRTYTTKRVAGPSRLAYEGTAGHSRQGSEAEGSEVSRPSSRAALRQSVGRGRASMLPSAVPRPVSRQGNHVLGVSTMSSRPVTPSLPSARAPTPSGHRPTSSASSSLGNRTLATSTRPRAGSNVLAASTHGRSGSASRTGSDQLAQSTRRPVSRQGTRDAEGERGSSGSGSSKYGALGGAGKMLPPPMPSPGTQSQALRRASLQIKSRLPERPGSALGRSVRRPSGVGGPE